MAARPRRAVPAPTARKRPRHTIPPAPLPQLRALLAAAAEMHPRGVLGVAEAVTATGLGVVSRQHVARILGGRGDAALHLSQLAALDAYLSTLPLGGLFKPARLLDSLAVRGTVALVLPRHPKEDDQADNVSFWDFRSMAEVLTGMDAARVGLRREIHTVPRLPSDASSPLDLTDFDRLLGPAGPSIISFGSPRASAASERLLCHMFGVPERTPDPALPFAFAWPRADRVVSSFATTTEELAAESGLRWRPQPQDGERWWAFRLRKTVYLERRQEVRDGKLVRVSGGRKSFGVVAAQQQANGQLWLVAAGLSGPATYAVCEALVGELSLRPVTVTERQPVWWVAVEVNVHTDEGVRVGENRVSRSRTVLGSSETA